MRGYQYRAPSSFLACSNRVNYYNIKEKFMSDSLTSIQSSLASVRQFFSDVFEGATAGDFSKKESAGKIVGQVGSGLIPLYGQVADLRDTAAAVEKTVEGREGGIRDLLLSLVGWVPLFGDSIKGSFRTAGGIFRKVDNLPSSAGDDLGGLLSRSISRSDESEISRLVYKPSVEMDNSLSIGEGFTDKYGNVVFSGRGSEIDQALVYHHEMVHSFLSPRLDVFREFRADVRMTGYQRSSFLRYLEEALAETYAQVKVNGLNPESVYEGISFPIKNGYVELRNVVTEGAFGTVTVGGALYGVYVASSTNE